MTTINPAKISTNRLDLIAATLEHVLAELKSLQSLASLLRAEVADGWPPGEYDRSAQEFFRDRLKEGGHTVVGWYGWYAVRRGDTNRRSVLVGAAGYFGPPNEQGEVEIGLSVMPAWREQGFATEIVRALIENAFNDPRVNKIIAHTTPANVASCRLLEKCGFLYVGKDGPPGNILYELPRQRSQSQKA
ncbi:MAG: GNAT family N-acetyltransferase [Candidatus Zixiibacteriota bacterium]